MKNKGFTLVELLAVVTIFSIICLLAIPPILNQVNSNRNAVSKANLDIIYKAVDIYLDNVKASSTYCVSLQELVDRDLLASPIKDFDNGNELDLTRTVKVVTDANKAKTYSLLAKGTVCTPTDIIPTPVPIKAYTEGEIIYYNPETNKKCTSTEVNPAVNAKTGCLKWNVITTGDTTSNTTVNIMLDHNSTALVEWNSSNTNTEMKEVATALQTDVTTWNTSIKSTARLITGQEVANIGKDTMWNPGKFTGTKYTEQSWLYQNTYNNGDNSNYGYWTSTASSSSWGFAWRVYSGGDLSDNSVTNADNSGVRPVITISKSVIS